MDTRREIMWEDGDSDFEDLYENESEESEEFIDLLRKTPTQSENEQSSFHVGDKITAKITLIPDTTEFILLDCGTKAAVLISKEELKDEAGNLNVQIGDSITAYVAQASDSEILLSKNLSAKLSREQGLEEAYHKHVPVMGKVAKLGKAGFEVSVMGRTAFCPFSQIDFFAQDKESYVGKEFEFYITQYAHRNLVVSRTKLLEERAKTTIQEFKERLEAGQDVIAEGKVKEIKEFGMFIDISGLIGLLHISQLSYGRFSNKLEDEFKIGQKLKVQVLSIAEAEPGKMPRISLSTKSLQIDPWSTISENYKVGESYEGRVIKLLPMGALVELEAGLDGLIHLSEMSWTKRILKPEEVLNVGDSVTVRILEIDLPRKRISLSMKSIEHDPWFNIEKKYQEKTQIEGEIEALRGFGAIVKLEDGVSGLVPVSDLRALHGEAFRKKASPGLKLLVQVVRVDKETKRILLTLPGISHIDESVKDFEEYVAKETLKKKEASSNEYQGSFGSLLSEKLRGK